MTDGWTYGESLKYSPDQPRVPRGNPDGGQWTDGGGPVIGRFKVPDSGPLAGDPEAIKSEEYDRNFETDRPLRAGEEKTLESYIVDGYSNINRYLNGYQFGEAKGFRSPFFESEIDNLDAAISASRTVNDIEVWRGFRAPRDLSRDDFTALLFAGDVITEKGFLSTSFNREIAVSMANLRSTPMLLRIKVPKGASALHIPANYAKVYGEHEVLLPRGTSLRLLTRPEWRRIGGERGGAYVADAEVVKGA